MSSSSGRGPTPPTNNSRYSEYEHYDYDYSKNGGSSSNVGGSKRPPKKQQFHSGTSGTSSRRDFTKSSLPGSSSLTHSMNGPSDDYSGSVNQNSGRRFGSNRGGAYGSYGGGGGGNHYSGDRYGYNKPWRSGSGSGSVSGSGPSGSGSGSGPSGVHEVSGVANSSPQSYNVRSSMNGNHNNNYRSDNSVRDIRDSTGGAISPSFGGNSGGEYRKDRYDSYSGNNNNNLNNNVNNSSRSSLSNSVSSRPPFQSKDRSRLNTFHVGGGQGSGNLSTSGGKRSDTYYPSRNYNSLNQPSFNGKQLDRYSNNKYRGSSSFKKGKRGYGDDIDNAYDQRRDYRNYQHGYSETSTEEYHKTSYDNNVHRFKTNNKDTNTDNSGGSSAVDPNSTYESIHEKDINSSLKEGDISKNSEEGQEDDEEEEDVTRSTRNRNILDDADEDEDEEEEEEDEVDDEESTPKPEIKLEDEKVKAEQNIQSVDVSNEVCYANGCNFPLNYLDTKYLELQEEFETLEKHEEKYSMVMKYSVEKPTLDFKEHAFYIQNIKAYINHKKDFLSTQLNKNAIAMKQKKLSLWNKMNNDEKKWKVKSINMDQQLSIIHSADDEMRKELDSIDIRAKHDTLPEATTGAAADDHSSVGAQSGVGNGGLPVSGGGRRNRRHGDLVTTEAEFQEILQSLGREQAEDPMVKAEHVAAKIPDFILDPIQRNYVKYMDSNNIVQDKDVWSRRIHSDFDDNFSAEEHELFTEGFCINPKRFGAISRHMGGLRSAEECVVHYYVSKKDVNYKQLVSQYKKKANKKNNRRKNAKPRSVSSSNTPISTPATDSVNEEIAVDTSAQVKTSEELFTETGRRKRAAAPTTFDTKHEKSEKKDITDEQPKKKVKKSKPEGEDHAVDEKHDIIVPEATTTSAVADETTLTTDSSQPSSVPPKTPLVPVVSTAETIENSSIEETPVEDGNSTNKIESSSAPIPIQDTATDNETFQDSHTFYDGREDKRRAITSYWSITEATVFPELLAEHGTKWTTIADKLATKTATMVRNYFQRNAEKQNWGEVVRIADARSEAKFAAVIGTKNDIGEPISNPSPSYSYHGYPESQAQTTAIVSTPGIAIGTFQHNNSHPPVVGAVVDKQPSQVPPASINKGGHSITSLLSNDEITTPTVTYQSFKQPEQKQVLTDTQPVITTHKPPTSPPQRSSIMSLLNSDSSPAKPTNIVSNGPTMPRKTTLTSLLNSPQSTVYEGPSGHGLSNLLSATEVSPPPYTGPK
ncbi:hypothetical protein CAAN1_06S05226 [[Candida] anglica]|uniref:SANT domain-containing protein n=1 Tax=[Candida] anglica TaxID=148631 RepID=A0ABP0EL46_9ASCO